MMKDSFELTLNFLETFMRNEIDRSDSLIETDFDKLGWGVLIEDIVFTRETFTDFLNAAQNYHSCGRVENEVINDFPALIMRETQLFKHEPRKDVIVINYGSVRAVCRI
jgi:hypothetical protein